MMKPIYRCDWCGKQDIEENIRCHEPICNFNKELHSCYTCQNQKGLIRIECSAGKEVPEGNYFSFCPLWEDNGKDMTKSADFGDIFSSLFGGKA